MTSLLLIVCHNQEHISKVREAFEIDATYTTPQGALAGSRFKKIVVFRPEFHGHLAHSESLRFNEWVNEYLPLKLQYGCEGNIIFV